MSAVYTHAYRRAHAHASAYTCIYTCMCVCADLQRRPVRPPNVLEGLRLTYVPPKDVPRPGSAEAMADQLAAAYNKGTGDVSWGKVLGAPAKFKVQESRLGAIRGSLCCRYSDPKPKHRDNREMTSMNSSGAHGLDCRPKDESAAKQCSIWNSRT